MGGWLWFLLSVACLAAAMALAAVGLLVPTLAGAADCLQSTRTRHSGAFGRPPALPRCVARLVRSDTFARMLLCRPNPPERPRVGDPDAHVGRERQFELWLPMLFLQWRECPGGCAEQVLEMLDKLDAEESRRDWMMLATALEKLCAVLCLALASASLAPSLAPEED